MGRSGFASGTAVQLLLLRRQHAGSVTPCIAADWRRGRRAGRRAVRAASALRAREAGLLDVLVERRQLAVDIVVDLLPFASYSASRCGIVCVDVDGAPRRRSS